MFRKLKFMGYALYLVVPSLLIMEIFLCQIEKKYVDVALVNLDAQAAIQKARIQDMIDMYYQRILNVTSRRVLKKNLAHFWEYGDVAQLVQMKRSLPNVKQPFADFKKIFIFDREGTAVTSTEESLRGVIPVNRRVLEEGRERLTVTFFEPIMSSESKANSQSKSESKLIELLLMGPIFYKGKPIGGVGIVADNSTLMRIVGDRSGLGETGETRIAKKNERGDAEIIARSRLLDRAQGMANIPQHQLNNPMTQALFRYEGILRKAVDYRGIPVFAATRFIPEEDWGVVVKIDQEEVLRPVRELRRFAYNLLGLILVFWLATAALWFR